MIAGRSVLSRIYLPLLILVIAGIGLRLLAIVAVSPAVLNIADSHSYIQFAHTEVFSDPVHPAGYPMFLKIVEWVSSSAVLPIYLQHLVGIVTGLLLYATVRRLGVSRWVGVIPAGFVLLSLDQLTLEHEYMAETLFTFLVVATAYCATRGLVTARAFGGLTRPAGGWLVVAGALLAFAAYLRTAAVFLVPFLALWALLTLPKPWWRCRTVGAGVALAAAVVVALVYAAANDAKTGYFGFTRAGGWSVYARTAQFADCSKFTPPPGTGRLCEPTDAAARPGPQFYFWHRRSPGQRLFGWPPAGSDTLGTFGRQAIQHQPLEYARTVFTDTVRAFAPTYQANRPYSGVGPEAMDFDRRTPEQEASIVRLINRWYSDTRMRVRDGPARVVHDLQQLLRAHGVVLLQLVILAIAGLFAARGAVRAVIALCLGGGVLLLIIPAATVVYSARYSVPAAGLLAAAGALAAWTLGQWAVSRTIEQRPRSKSGVERKRVPAGTA